MDYPSISLKQRKSMYMKKYREEHKENRSIYMKKYIKQDKVNYAVSEREDRVTDVTTLTRMTGCTGMYWAVLGCTEL